MVKHKVAIFTAGRSDFGILKKIIYKLNKDKKINLIVLVGIAHSSTKFGRTQQEVEELKVKNIFNIKTKIIGSDTFYISKYFNDTLNQSSDFIKKNKIKLGIVLGDRYETMAFSLACFNNGVKLVHFCGGTNTLGSKDNLYRKMISFCSSLHLVETSKSKKNLIKIGIERKNIFIVGAPALEQIKIKKNLLKIFKRNQILFSFHPETNKSISFNEKNLKICLNFLNLKNEKVIITYPNADEGFDNFISIIKKYKSNRNFKIIKNLGIDKYHQTLMQSKLLIGNTSSGIIESASFKIPFINLGERQKGRFQNLNTINCKFNKTNITKAYQKATSVSFLKKIEKSKNIYFKRHCSKNSVMIIKSFLKMI